MLKLLQKRRRATYVEIITSDYFNAVRQIYDKIWNSKYHKRRELFCCQIIVRNFKKI